MKKKRLLLIEPDPWVGLLAKALAQQGHEVNTLNPAQADSAKTYFQWILNFNPDWTLGRNSYTFTASPWGLEQGLWLWQQLASQEIPHAAWYLDNPIRSGSLALKAAWGHSLRPYNTVFFCADKAHTDFFTSKALKANHLPMAVDADLEKETFSASQRFQMPLVFVGTPPHFGQRQNAFSSSREILSTMVVDVALDMLTLADQKQPLTDTRESVGNHMVSAIQKFFSTWYTLPAGYEKAKEELMQKVSPWIQPNALEDNFNGFDYRYSFCQLALCLWHLKKRGIRVYGGDDWKWILGDYQPSYDRIDFNTELPSLLHAAKITFCLTKWQYSGAVHDRPLMTLACGGFPLTDYRSELDESFDPDEIASYRHFDQAKSLIDYYLTHESQRQIMAAKGRARVFKQHTYQQRAWTICKIMADTF